MQILDLVEVDDSEKHASLLPKIINFFWCKMFIEQAHAKFLVLLLLNISAN